MSVGGWVGGWWDSFGNLSASMNSRSVIERVCLWVRDSVATKIRAESDRLDFLREQFIKSSYYTCVCTLSNLARQLGHWDLSSKTLHIHLAKLRFKVFFNQPFLVVKKPGSDHCKLPLKAPVEGKEEIQKVTASLAAANKTSENAAAAAV